MKKEHSIWLFVVAACLAASVLVFSTAGHTSEQTNSSAVPQTAQESLRSDATVSTTSTNPFTISVQISDTPAERAQGLSDLPSMTSNQGMLFLFPASTITSFWMKDMNFPLDIIWINGNKVVDVWANAPAPTNGASPAIYTPKAAANAVLEVNAGQANAQGITVGSTLDIQLPSGYTWPTN